MARYEGGARNRSARRRKIGSRSRRGPSDLLWWCVSGICAVVIVAVITGSQFLVSAREIDADTLCHARGPVGVTIILLDLTDPLNRTQQARLKAMIEGEISESGTDTMIALGVVSESPNRWGALFSKCKPVTGEKANVLYENPSHIMARYNREFLVPIRKEIDATLTGRIQNRSPIMEALQSLIASTPQFANVPEKRKIIIVSDMLQHSDNLSFYRHQGWNNFIDGNGENRLAGNLSGTVVEIIRIPRFGGSTPPNDLVEDFWSRYFDRQGSFPPKVTSLGDL